MEIFGEPLFAKGPDGRLVSRIGTLFLKTPAIVTKRGVHATQRAAWIEELSARRIKAGLPPLSQEEQSEEIMMSVDLVFTADFVLIRPDPARMDLAFRADEELQKLVSKRMVRYLNTSSLKVRAALCERGENWRMARQPISQDDISDLIERSKVSIGENSVYYYNKYTGTRFLTAGAFESVFNLPDAAFLAQMKEISSGLNSRNRHGHPEIALFPQTSPPEIASSLRAFKCDGGDIAAVKAQLRHVSSQWRMSLPSELRVEDVSNFEWRNEMCHAITRKPDETSAEERELISGISPEFYRQIEWMPGARINRGELLFDEIWSELRRTGDPEAAALCDSRVKALILNCTRLFSDIDFINVGRISHSLARHPVDGERRGNVYVLQYRETGRSAVNVLLVRFQKWGVKERLDEGKDITRAMIETDEYTDYILDRRLMCRQLGMKLTERIGCGYITENYTGEGPFKGMPVRTPYFVRPYIGGTASDKIPPSRFHNPAFARSFARLMGEAAAVDLVVARRSSKTGAILFDQNYEIVGFNANNLPQSVTITDHAGSFVGYNVDFAESVKDYANVVLRRRTFVVDYRAFAEAYIDAFRRRLAEVRDSYLARREVFDGLFKDRPFDPNGSASFRWSTMLSRLEKSDPVAVAGILEKAVFSMGGR